MAKQIIKGTESQSSTLREAAIEKGFDLPLAQRLADVLNGSKVGMLIGKMMLDLVAGLAAVVKTATEELTNEQRHRFNHTLCVCIDAWMRYERVSWMANPVNPLYETMPHDSTNVQHSAYDPTKQILEVCFKNGGVYHYLGVPPQVRDEMMQAESVGSFLAKVIKPAYKCEKQG